MDAPPVDPAAIARAVEALKRGGLVAVPTETVYGLAADADNEDAVRAIFAAKGRPVDHPVIVHIAGQTQLADWAHDAPLSARRLADAFWPGPLTLVLKRAPRVLDVITGGQDTVGLRSPSHPWAQALLRVFGGGLAAPSANRFGRISPTTAGDVVGELGLKPEGAVDVILDGGPCPVGIESTIVDLSADRPRLLRPGMIGRRDLEAVLQVPLADADSSAPRASGRLETHYAPRTPLELVAISDLAARIAACRPQTVAVLAPAGSTGGEPNLKLHLLAADTEADFARLLYAQLRRLDASGADRLLVALPPETADWEAVHDRLARASAGSAAPAGPARK